MDRIIKFSLDNRILIVALSAMIMIAGMVAIFKTDVDIFPDLNAPTVVVMTEAPRHGSGGSGAVGDVPCRNIAQWRGRRKAGEKFISHRLFCGVGGV